MCNYTAVISVRGCCSSEKAENTFSQAIKYAELTYSCISGRKNFVIKHRKDMSKVYTFIYFMPYANIKDVDVPRIRRSLTSFFVIRSFYILNFNTQLISDSSSSMSVSAQKTGFLTFRAKIKNTCNYS